MNSMEHHRNCCTRQTHTNSKCRNIPQSWVLSCQLRHQPFFPLACGRFRGFEVLPYYDHVPSTASENVASFCIATLKMSNQMPKFDIMQLVMLFVVSNCEIHGGEPNSRPSARLANALRLYHLLPVYYLRDAW